MAVDTKVVPMVHTEDITTLISDSGITRYRIIAKVFDIFVDSVPEPYWYFPKGIYVEKFDSVFNVEGSITADTAYRYYERQKLWRAIGNVKVVNFAGEKFETSELFWSEKEKRIYTDKFITVERKGQIHMGYGLESNQEVTNWHILNHSGTYDIPEDSIGAGQTNERTDIHQAEPVKQ